MPSENAAIHVICLGAGGGPSEDNVTGFLVRSTGAKWSKNSILAVDAGTHLSAIQRILEHDFPIVANNNHAPAPNRPAIQRVTTDDGLSSDVESVMSTSSDCTPQQRQPTILESGPFAGMSFPHMSARANAVHVVREHVSTYLITHPHLDHFSGFAINTAAFHNTSRPKRLAALPFTVNAIKTHIFNDVVWPNLTDEEGGVGFVTFQRLTEGGNLALGEGSSRGFIEVCDGLAVKGFKVSHGRCAGAPQISPSRRGSAAANTIDSIPPHQHNHAEPISGLTYLQQNGGSRTPKPENRRTSVYSQHSQPGTPNLQSQEQSACVVDSSAFFIRADDTGREILMFGDVEPDSISAFPRNHMVWTEAASRIVHGALAGVFIECSYNDTQRDAVLFGHLAPRHLIRELEVLAELVVDKKKDNAEKVGRKRKRQSMVLANLQETPESPVSPSFQAQDETPRSSRLRTNASIVTPGSKRASFADAPILTAGQLTETPGVAPQSALTMDDGNITTGVPKPQYEGPLKGLTVVVIHVKDTMTDEALVGETILQDLWQHEARLASQGKALGCKFEIASSGQSYWF